MWWILFFLGYLSIRKLLFRTISCNPFQNQRKIEKVVFFKKTSVLCFHQTQMITFSWSMNFMFYHKSKHWVVCGRRKLFGHMSSYLRGLLSVCKSDCRLFLWYTYEYVTNDMISLHVVQNCPDCLAPISSLPDGR